MAKSIMIQGTTSNAGKTLTVAGLCRILREEGYKVAPFKAQNLALNSYITDNGLEMGRAQVVQAEACCIKPDIRMNPILLKPSENSMQVILNGKVLPPKEATYLYANKKKLMDEIMKSYNSLSKEYDIIVLEGAGSPAEINLKGNDIVNMNMAKYSNSPVILVGDIERGGVFASLYGTLMLLTEEERERIKGLVINKFSGDIALLSPALDMFKSYSTIPFVGVIPYIDVDIDEEDVLTYDFKKKNCSSTIDIGILKLPFISNYTDFNNLGLVEGVSIRYISSVSQFSNPDLLIIPGTKSTILDLLWIRKQGLDKVIFDYHRKNKPIIGICGGFQMLCKTIKDEHNVEYNGTVTGLGLLDYNTLFHMTKVRTNKSGVLDKVDGIFQGISSLQYEGYEIHMGTTNTDKNIVNNKNVYGTYIHGIFDKKEIALEIVKALYSSKGLDFKDSSLVDYVDYRESQYQILAKELRKALDMEVVYKIINS